MLHETPACLSCLCLWLLGFYILKNPKLKMHPYPLIGWVCITDSYLFNYLFSWVILIGTVCRPDIFQAFTLNWGPCWLNKIVKYLLNIYLGVNLRSTFFAMNLMINSFLFIDLYYTLKNPFKPRESRSKWYFILTTLYGLINFIFYSLNLFSTFIDRRLRSQP